MIHLLDKNEQIVDVLVNPSPDKWYNISKMTEDVDNSLLSLEFTTIYQIDSSKIAKVVAQDRDGKHRLFLISNIEDKDDESLLKTIQCDGDHYSLGFERPIAPTTLTGVTLREAAEFLLQDTNYQLGQVDFEGIDDVAFKDFTFPLAGVQQLKDQFKCVSKFRVEMIGKTITRFLDLLQPSDDFSGKELVIDKDITGLDRQEDRDNIITRMIGYAIDADGNVITFEDINDGKNYIESAEAFAEWNFKGRHRYGVHQYQPEDGEEIDKQKMLAATREAFELVNDATVAYQATAAALEQIEGYEHEKIRIGMNIRIRDDRFNPTLFLTAQVNQTEMPELDDPSGDFVYQLGDYKLIDVKQEQQISDLQSKLGRRSPVWDGSGAKADAAKQAADDANQTANDANQTANNAKASADGKSKIVTGPTAPEDKTSFWIDTSGGLNKPGVLKHYDQSREEFVDDSITQFTDMLGEIINKQIADGAVTVDKLDVKELSAIAENVGHLTGGLIEGVQIIGSEIESISEDGNSKVILFDGTITSYNGDARIVDIDELGVNIYDVTDALVGGLRWASSGDLNGLGVRGAMDFISLGFALDPDGITSADWMFLDNTQPSTTIWGSNKPGNPDGELLLKSTATGGSDDGLVPYVDILHAPNGDETFRSVIVQTGMGHQRPGESGFRTGFEVWQYLGLGNSDTKNLLAIDSDDSTKLSYTLLNTDQVFVNSGTVGQGKAIAIEIDPSISGSAGDLATNAIMHIGRITNAFMPAGQTTVAQNFDFFGAKRIFYVNIQGTDANSALYNARAFQISPTGWVTHIQRADGKTTSSNVPITLQYTIIYEAN